MSRLQLVIDVDGLSPAQIAEFRLRIDELRIQLVAQEDAVCGWTASAIRTLLDRLREGGYRDRATVILRCRLARLSRSPAIRRGWMVSSEPP